MGSTNKQMKHTRRMQTRTKAKGGKYTSLSDSASNNALLSTQLHALGLYAVETLGDGNCLFRALSDQLYGTPSYHFQLRAEICDWINAHHERYEPFVEDGRGLDVHLKNMREFGTYGGHLELSAFAHLKRRNVKVIQPGLVYVIEWSGGDILSPVRENASWRRKGKSRESDEDDDSDHPAVYVAYHDWEHFSSLRNLSGPHQGAPSVTETPQPQSIRTPIKLRIPRPKAPSNPIPIDIPSTIVKLEPSSISLPRSVSPSSQESSRLTSTSSSSLLTPEESTSPRDTTIRLSRSPKRTFDESEGDCPSETVPYSDKKHRLLLLNDRFDLEDDQASDLSSVVSTPPPESQASTPARALSPLRASTDERPLTRRQRKALGLPKPRLSTAGKIVIPGGNHPKRQGKRQGKGWVIVSDEEDANSLSKESEWVRNGTGRVDVRGFKELKI